jgi:hypothetical protein
MKHASILLIAIAAVLYAGSSAVAQHGHGASGSMGHSMSHASHTTPNTSGSPFSPNAKVTSKLSSLLASKGLVPQGTDLSKYCQGFRNRGQCIATMHVAHNRNVNFACLAHDATGQTNSAWGTVPTNCPTVSGKASLGGALHAIDPSTDAGAQVRSANKQAKQDLNEADKS